MKKNIKIIPVFIPHYGCKTGCYFCNQNYITGIEKVPDVEEIKKYIELYISSLDENNEKEIAFFGGSFTALNANFQEKTLEIAYEMKRNEKVSRIRISTRPDCIDKSVISRLKKFDIDIIELGVQSMDDDVLFNINRGHNSTHTREASILIKEAGFILGHQIMPGLYTSSIHKDLYTAAESIKLEPDIARIYPALVIKDTVFETLYKEGKYLPETEYSIIERVALIYSMYAVNNVDVIRVGLQPTENITFGKDIVAGPFHPAFFQNVLSYIIMDAIKAIFTEPSETMFVEADNEMLNYIIGNGKRNYNYLKEKKYFKKLIINERTDYKKIVCIKTEKKQIKMDIKGFCNEFLKLRQERLKCI